MSSHQHINARQISSETLQNEEPPAKRRQLSSCDEGESQHLRRPPLRAAVVEEGQSPSTTEELTVQSGKSLTGEEITCNSNNDNNIEAVDLSVVSSDGTDDRTSKDYYFDSYAHHAIHEEMLKDEVRTKTYEMAIMQNKYLFQDKIILDVGCGTGILSMFAAQAGAKHVYAVDCSSIADQARKIVELNGFSDKITVIKGKIEEIDLPVAEVDVIVSEWMGYFLLYESMLDSIIFARDKWLVKENGIVFPDKAVMYVCAAEDGDVKRDRVDFWSNVYGFDMSPIRNIALKEPVVDVIDGKSIVTDATPILHLDILTCKKEDVEFEASFELKALRNDYVHGLVAYFECAFTQVHKPIGFSTSPFCRYTHWKQTIFYLPESLVTCTGETIAGEIKCKPNKKNRRDLDISITLSVNGRHSKFTKQLNYRLR
ncbi:50S ribosomal protein L11 methylase [Nitzschia inconspicua]|uniref:50S ribosomal protein L11 methylase n=1 Tax=Nitzschia inconspicua TaxID=303405 RepID=A0A9K3L7S9_9STRA|nr:50S ribosomal protein L11 methylase [Nitzschia inconspicua]